MSLLLTYLYLYLLTVAVNMAVKKMSYTYFHLQRISTVGPYLTDEIDRTAKNLWKET